MHRSVSVKKVFASFFKLLSRFKYTKSISLTFVYSVPISVQCILNTFGLIQIWNLHHIIPRSSISHDTWKSLVFVECLNKQKTHEIILQI